MWALGGCMFLMRRLGIREKKEAANYYLSYWNLIDYIQRVEKEP
jgi:hypothetical protein